MSGAILWVGAEFGLLTCLITLRRGDERTVLDLMGTFALLGMRPFMPAGLVVLESGLAMIWVRSMAWEAWNLLALAGVAVPIALGAGVLGPTL